jgi:hypothetical protein
VEGVSTGGYRAREALRLAVSLAQPGRRGDSFGKGARAVDVFGERYPGTIGPPCSGAGRALRVTGRRCVFADAGDS